MSRKLKNFLQYLLILAAAVFLVWFSLRGLTAHEGQNKWEYLTDTWARADKGWLMLMAGIAVASHILRAVRWSMLIKRR
ncbi:MAG: hypothetical protein HC859_03550 [Bacteroidia bacterium]|nr:hypothetical protein [Bacteroidia bacterium]